MWGEMLACGREDPELLAQARETKARALLVRAGEEGELSLSLLWVLADESNRRRTCSGRPARSTSG